MGEIARPRKSIPAGSRFNRLVTTGLSRMTGRNANRVYQCVCDCGNERWVQRGNLVYNTTKSCGCLRREILSQVKRKHRTSPPINEEINHYKYTAKKRGLSWSLNHDQAGALLVGACKYCGAFPDRKIASRFGEEIPVSGIDRVDSSLGYTTENCVSCCTTCNYAKSNKSLSDWNKWIQKLIRFQLQRINNSL